MLACNDDNGMFDGNIRMIDIHDSMMLESCFIDDEHGFDFVGVEFSLDSGTLVSNGHRFPYVRRLEWCGNMCWDLFVMYALDCQRLLNYLQGAQMHGRRIYTCVEGESRLFEHWNAGRQIGEKQMGLIAKFSIDFRL